MTVKCPECEARIQRRMNGTLLDGLNDHLRVVHGAPPRERLPPRLEAVMAGPLPSREALAAAEAAWIEEAGVAGEAAQWYAHKAYQAAWGAAVAWAGEVMDGHGATHCARLLRGGEGS